MQISLHIKTTKPHLSEFLPGVDYQDTISLVGIDVEKSRLGLRGLEYGLGGAGRWFVYIYIYVYVSLCIRVFIYTCL